MEKSGEKYIEDAGNTATIYIAILSNQSNLVFRINWHIFALLNVKENQFINIK
jgi:hypothetical protein